MKPYSEHMRYLKHLAKEFSSQEAVAEAIINLEAQLNLPKGTEHFISDIHGEYEAFSKLVSHASGSIKRKIEEIFQETLSAKEQVQLGALIYDPDRMLGTMLPGADEQDQWYQNTLYRMIQVLRAVASKYPRFKVRQLIEGRFEGLVEELLYEKETLSDKAEYYQSIIRTTVASGHGRAFIVVIAEAIQRLAIDHLHVVGDIFDRGPGAHLIMDRLMSYHSIDIQWGNHDILWMGAASGCDACIANVIRISLRHGNMDTLIDGYAISLLPLASLAIEIYGDDSCDLFLPQKFNASSDSEGERRMMAQMHKAITVIQFKLEAQIIARRPEYGLENRRLLHHLDLEQGTVKIDDQMHPLKDALFQTVAPESPYTLTSAEQHVMDRLKVAFLHSEKLQQHTRFLFNKGSIHKIYNGNLLYHGCIPMNSDGSFTSLHLGNKEYEGSELMEAFDNLARQGFFCSEDSIEKQSGQDAMWYLWCGPCSPLFGKDKMTTFEQYFIADKATHKEPRNIYYTFRDDEQMVKRMLERFGLNPETGHIINGHVPVIVKEKELPQKGRGRLLVIDGGFAKAYQKKTGIAGYTLVSNSWGLLLATHQRKVDDLLSNTAAHDIDCTTEILENRKQRIRIKDTDVGREMRQTIEELTTLHEAYQKGIIVQDRV